jgi:DNA anti-recombination protein RmuC
MTKQTEVEVAGIKFRGGKIFLLLTALSTLGGGAWATFEFYKDYMDMKEIVQNIDTTEIKNQQEQITVKLDEAIAYTRDIKTGLRDDILSIEKQVDRVEDKLRETEQEVRDIVANAEERFENKRDALQNDYDEKANRLSESSQTRMDDLTEKVERDMNDLEIRLNKKLQRALDNPLAN